MRKQIISLLIIFACLALPLAVLAQFGLEGAAPDALKKGGDIPTMIGNIIKGFLALTGLIFLILMVYGGAQYMIARGDLSKTKSARDIMFNAIIGLLIIMASYALTEFILASVSGSPQ